jgi:hypothetical protein
MDEGFIQSVNALGLLPVVNLAGVLIELPEPEN